MLTQIPVAFTTLMCSLLLISAAPVSQERSHFHLPQKLSQLSTQTASMMTLLETLMTILALSGMMLIQIPVVSTILILSKLLNSAALAESLNLSQSQKLLLSLLLVKLKSQFLSQFQNLKHQLAKHKLVLMRKAAVTAPVKEELNHQQNVEIILTGLRMVSLALLASQVKDKSLISMENAWIAQTTLIVMYTMMEASTLFVLLPLAIWRLTSGTSTVLVRLAQLTPSLMRTTLDATILLAVIERSSRTQFAIHVMITPILILMALNALLILVITSLSTSISMDLARLAIHSNILIQTALVDLTEAAELVTAMMVLTISCNGVTRRLAEPILILM
jgi:hypothetical protein